jgi:hypothetical protein
MKILNYNELILEKLILGINESIIYYSPPLKDILNKIAKKENEIAKELVNLEGTDVKPDVTYLDIDKEGFLSFITMKNVEKKLKDKGLRDDLINDIVNQGGNTGIHLSSALYDQDYNYGIFSKSRNPIKLGKLLNQVLKGSYTDKEKEEFVNLFKARISGSDEKFELVEGSDIPFWYNRKNYAEEKGQLGGSCMRGGYDRYFQIYADHPEVCKMLILKDDENKLLGRSLIWKINSKNKDLEFEYFMDRQYTIKESDVQKFRDYADSQGWAYKTNNNHSSYYGVTYKGENHSITMEVKTSPDYETFPYLDTFKMYDPSTGILNNDRDSSDEYEDWYILEDTGGGYEVVESGVWSDWHDRMIPEDEAVYSEAVSSWIYRDDAVEIEHGWTRHHGWWPEDHDDILYDEYNNYWIHQDDTTYCEDYNESIHSDTAVDIITDIEFDGDVYSNSYYWEDDSSVIDINELISYEFLKENRRGWDDYDYIHKDLLIKNYKGYWILHMLRIEVYDLKEEFNGVTKLRKIDAEVLGLEIDKSNSYLVDKISYYQDISNILEELYEKSTLLARKLKDDYEGKGQLRLKFSDEDETIWKSKTFDKIKEVKVLIDDVDNEYFLEKDWD